ncbi:MAG TPA: metallophosphoesterase [Candidatus Saccharimonadales bacterium]|jgi:predicted phosphodiesterase|nr:metallophosphoesterase [Candidatus Saccharimonadales bacterium]
MNARWSLLCLTDLHYASSNVYGDDGRESSQPGVRDDIFDSFYQIIEQGFEVGSIDLIAVCGDITTRGNEKGLKQFQDKALPSLQRLLKNRNQSLCLVPGNHDVSFGHNPGDINSYDEKFKAFAQLAKESHATSCLFPHGPLAAGNPDKLTFTAIGHGPIHVDRKRRILSLCINSAVRCHELNAAMRNDLIEIARSALRAPQEALSLDTNDLLAKTRPQLLRYLVRDVAHVTQGQRHLLAKELKKKKATLGDEWDSYLKVAILHHHLIPFRGQVTEHKSYSQLLDSSQVLALLTDFDFDLVLTGHKHQPYQEEYGQDHKIVVIGGPTLGGEPFEFQGIRHIEIEDRGGRRHFKVADISYQEGNGNVPENVSRCMRKSKTIAVSRAAKDFLRYAHKEKFYYREVTSATILNSKGDAERVVEYDDLIYFDEHCKRRKQHKIILPSTSGHLSPIRARGRDSIGIKLDRTISEGSREQSAEATLIFNSMIGVSAVDGHKSDERQGYIVEWRAINGFSLNKRQWTYKYSRDTKCANMEFTHFAPEEPIEDLTILAQFPAPRVGLKAQPFPRVVVVDPTEPDRRNWLPDDEARELLLHERALRYFEAAGIAVLKVKYPRPGLSYGIQWEVEDAPEFHGNDQARIQSLWNRLKLLDKQPLSEQQHKGLIQRLFSFMTEVRSTLFKTRSAKIVEWNGQLDAGIMYFDGENSLARLIAITQEDGKSAPQELLYDQKLKYGDGIAGIAFKTNALCNYVDPGEKALPDRPDLYTPILKDHKHAVLMAFPLHIPVDDQKESHIYKFKPPYAVFNLGSTSPECPLAREDTAVENAMVFQHIVNKVVWDELRHLFEQKA